MLLTANVTSRGAWWCWWQIENYRKSFIHNTGVKKIPSEPDAVINRATSVATASASHRFPTPDLNHGVNTSFFLTQNTGNEIRLGNERNARDTTKNCFLCGVSLLPLLIILYCTWN